MSGGSWDYIQAQDVEDLVRESKWLEKIKMLADRLREERALGGQASRHTEEIAAEIVAIQETVVALEGRIGNLRSVWRALDYRDSCDIGDDEVQRVLTDYNANPGITPKKSSYTESEVKALMLRAWQSAYDGTSERYNGEFPQSDDELAKAARVDLQEILGAGNQDSAVVGDQVVRESAMVTASSAAKDYLTVVNEVQWNSLHGVERGELARRIGVSDPDADIWQMRHQAAKALSAALAALEPSA